MANSRSRSSVVSVFCAFSAVGILTYLVLELRRKEKQRKIQRTKQKTVSDGSPATNPQADHILKMMFDEAAAASTLLKSTTNGDKLMLYGLYKQATVGDAPVDCPSAFNVVAHAKHSAWIKFRSMSPSTAMSHYIQAVKELSGDSIGDDVSSNDFEGPALGMGLKPSKPVEEEDEPEVNGESLEARLRNAAATDGVLVMKDLIEQGADLNAVDDHGETALHFCADRGMLDGVVYLLELGANPNAADHDGITVLQAAVIAGHTDVCKILLDEGADPDHEDNDGDSPRSCASEDQSEKMEDLFANFKTSNGNKRRILK